MLTYQKILMQGRIVFPDSGLVFILMKKDYSALQESIIIKRGRNMECLYREKQVMHHDL